MQLDAARGPRADPDDARRTKEATVRLSGKTVVVTGAAHGIGRAYSERLASEGANVALLDIDAQRVEEVAAGIRERGGSAIGIDCDVRQFSQVEAATKRTAEEFGGITSLVNNAGMLNVVPVARVLFEEITDEDWDACFLLNTKSAWYATRAAVPYIRKAGGGSIVNIASSTILRAPATRAHYIASKSALIGFTRCLSRELGGDWIRVNAVCPGSTLSEEDPTPEIVAMRESAVATRALKRIERPEDMVGTIAFLVSDDSAFITGQTIVVVGGSVYV
jgi:3-oxoacyl-[acyl-carrier protein] reductase